MIRWRLLLVMGLLAAVFFCPVPAQAQDTPPINVWRVSVASDGTPGDDDSYDLALSADGNSVAFSTGADLVPGAVYGWWDIFVHSRHNGQTIHVPVTTGAEQTTSFSRIPTLSADGRFVAFRSSFESGGIWHLFLHDRQSGQTERVSVTRDTTSANGDSDWPSISADGRFVAFSSDASNLVTNDTNDTTDIFVYDRQMGQMNRVSVASGGEQANDHSRHPALSPDGRFVVFASDASNLIMDDTNYNQDIFIRDRDTDLDGIFDESDAVATIRVSVTTSGIPANTLSQLPVISPDGRFVAFVSFATNLTPGDTNGKFDVFVHDRDTDEDGIFDESGAIETTCVSTDGGGIPANGSSEQAAISADGRFVVFTSKATNLVANDTNAQQDIFLRDRQTGNTARISVASDGTQANSSSAQPTISADGRFIAFLSEASNLIPDDVYSTREVFLAKNPLLDKADLAISQEDSGSIAQASDEVTYTLTVTNQGPETATGVVLRNTLPAAATLVETTPAQYVCGPRAGELVCALGALTTGSSVSLNVKVRFNAEAVGSQTNSVIAEANQYDSAPQNNAATASLTLNAAPTNLSLNPLAVNQIALRWTDTDDESAFIIARSLDGQTGWEVIGQTAANTTLYVDSQLPCATAYSYRVRAYRASDETYSVYTNPVRVSTLACSPIIAAPERNHFDTKTVTLTWEAVTWAQGYEVQISNSKDFAGTYNHLQPVAAAALFWTTSELGNGTYYWRVHAQMAPGRWSAWSAVESFVIAAP